MMKLGENIRGYAESDSVEESRELPTQCPFRSHQCRCINDKWALSASLGRQTMNPEDCGLSGPLDHDSVDVFMNNWHSMPRWVDSVGESRRLRPQWTLDQENVDVLMNSRP